MAVRLRRLAMGVGTSTSTSIYRATTRTVIRTIDMLAGGLTVFGIGAADAASPGAGVFWASSGPANGYGSYRGAVVLEPGEQLFVDVESPNTSSFIVCGVTGVA